MKPTTQKLQSKTLPPTWPRTLHIHHMKPNIPTCSQGPHSFPPFLHHPPFLDLVSLHSPRREKREAKKNSKMLNTEAKKPRLTITTTTTTTTATSDERPDESVSVATKVSKDQSKAEEGDTGRERLKRHRMEMAGRVWIPEIWGQESFLKDWIDCSAFDSSLVPKGVVSARQALVEDCRRANSARGLRIENRC